MRSRTRRVSVGIVMTTLLVGGYAHGQAGSDRVTARSLFDEARALVAAGKVADACPKFEESQRLDPGPGTLFNLADCYERSGRTATAWLTFLDVATAMRAGGQA